MGMRVTSSMMWTSAQGDLARLRQAYAKAQAAVNGHVLERPSDDPAKVVESMDLSDVAEQLQRVKSSGQDASDWLNNSETRLTSILDQLQSAREYTVQAGSAAAQNPAAREQLANQVLMLRDSILSDMNGQYKGQYLFSGWKTDTKPFSNSDSVTPGGVSYDADSNGLITREIAPGLLVSTNVPGSKLLQAGDFMATLTNIANNLKSGNVDAVVGDGLNQLDKAMDNLTSIRSELGVRQDQIKQYGIFADDRLLKVQQRLSDISGGNMEQSIMNMTQTQAAYQAALQVFSKTLPTSLLDYMMR
ncbi:MAG: flagellin [Mycobacterium leprae]